MQIVVGHANPDFDAYAATIAATKVFPGSKAVFLGSQNANVRAFHNLHEGFFSFVEGAASDATTEAVARISTESLLMEGARRIDEWARIGQVGEG